MITSCPKIINCTYNKMIGNPQSYRRLELQQELVLSKTSPIVFKEESDDKENKTKKVYIPIMKLDTSSGEDWFIKARVITYILILVDYQKRE